MAKSSLSWISRKVFSALCRDTRSKDSSISLSLVHHHEAVFNSDHTALDKELEELRQVRLTSR